MYGFRKLNSPKARIFFIFLMEKSLKIRNLVQSIHFCSYNAPQTRKNFTFSHENVVLNLKPSRMDKLRLEAPQARKFFIFMFSGVDFFNN